jgi:hypothetical protein
MEGDDQDNGKTWSESMNENEDLARESRLQAKPHDSIATKSQTKSKIPDYYLLIRASPFHDGLNPRKLLNVL